MGGIRNLGGNGDRSARDGIGADGQMHETICLNCGARLVGTYCHACGQKGQVHRTLTAFADDFLSGVLNFEGKILRTLPCLVFQPGVLTRRYIEGQRARYVSPLALFLFAVFFFFAVIQSIGGSSGMGELANGENVYRSTDEAIAGARTNIAALQQSRTTADPEDLAEIDKDLADEKDQLATLEKIKEQGIGNAIIAQASNGGDIGEMSDVPVVGEALRRVKANPQLALYKIQDAVSKFAWLLIPISVPFVWLLFPFSRRYRLYDHTVFVAYSLSFMLLLAALLSLWATVGLPGVAVAVCFIPPFHMYRQLKGTYHLSRGSAIVRTGLLLTFASIAFGLFAALVVALGFIG